MCILLLLLLYIFTLYKGVLILHFIQAHSAFTLMLISFRLLNTCIFHAQAFIQALATVTYIHRAHYYWVQLLTHAFHVVPSMGPIVSVVS